MNPPQISGEHLKGTSLLVATPMAAEGAGPKYIKSLMELVSNCGMYGLPISWSAQTGDSVAKARDRIADRFLSSDATHLLFIDSDIEFDFRDALALVALSNTPNSPYDVIAGAYPRKHDSLTLIFDPAPGADTTSGNPFPVLRIGCGFMCVRRRTFDRLIVPTYLTPATSEPGSPAKVYRQFFCEGIEGGQHVSEDQWFCHQVRYAGMQVWVCPWIRLTHWGPKGYEAESAFQEAAE